MLAYIEKIYPRKNRIVYFLFDLSMLSYLIAYFAYYTDTSPQQIRIISTLLVFFFGVLLFISKIRIPQNWDYVVWYLLFLIIGVVSSLWAKKDTNVFSIMPSIVRIFFIAVFLYCRVEKEIDVELFLNGYVIASAYFSCMVISKMMQYFTPQTFYIHRLGLNIGYNPNTIALGAVFSFVILLHKMLISKGEILKQALYTFALLFFVIVILLTQSKKGLLGLMLGILMINYYRKRGIKKIQSIILGILLAIIVFQLIMSIPALYESVGSRIESALGIFKYNSYVDGSTENRLALIKEAINVWLSHPLVGVGLNNFSLYQNVGGELYYSHCNYVELLADIGIIGALFYYFLPVNLLIKKADNQNDLNNMIKTIIVIILVLDIGMVSYNELRIQVLYIVAALVIGNFRLSEN